MLFPKDDEQEGLREICWLVPLRIARLCILVLIFQENFVRCWFWLRAEVLEDSRDRQAAQKEPLFQQLFPAVPWLSAKMHGNVSWI